MEKKYLSYWSSEDHQNETHQQKQAYLNRTCGIILGDDSIPFVDWELKLMP